MDSSTLTFLDSYCERAGQAGIFSEPLNASTNLAFILAAWMACRALRSAGEVSLRISGDLWAQAGILFFIGIGSGLWHLVPNGVTLLADVVPITLFINLFLVSALRRLLACPWWTTAFCWAIYMAATIAAQKTFPPDLLNGTIMYIPSYAALLMLMLALIWKRSPVMTVFIRVVWVWTISLIFRTFDGEWCVFLPIGTHFLWHVFNAYVTYTLLRTLIAHTAAAKE